MDSLLIRIHDTQLEHCDQPTATMVEKVYVTYNDVSMILVPLYP